MSPTAATSPDWLAQMGQAMDQMLWVWDATTGRLVHANGPFRRFWGPEPLPEGDARRLLLSRVAAEDARRVERSRLALPATGYTEEYRLEQPAMGGTPARSARLREQAFAVPGPDGATWVTHVARDISWQFDTTAQLRAERDRRAHAERNLSDATARLEAMISTANDPVISIDQKSLVVDWNRAAERVFGWAREEVMGRNLADLIIPAVHRKNHAAGIEKFLRDGTAQIFNRRVETKAVRRSGEEFDVEMSVWPVRSSEGHTFSAFVRDISRRKAAARQLAESEAKYRKVVENVNEGILVTAAGRILYANPKALAITGLDEATALANPFIEFIHADDRERVLNNHMKRIRGEPVENYYQFRVIHKSGDVRWLEISAVVFEWQGQPATLNFLTDVTERRRAEEDIRNALARERELSELKSRFVAVASHEFRTPLAAILSSVELLDDYGPRLPEGERKEIVGLIKSAVSRMNGMIEQVLMTSKLESGRFVFDPSPQSVPGLMVEVAAEMDQANPQASRIAMHCEGVDAPRRLDAQLVRHVLMNLLSNALKYSPPDSAVGCAVTAEGDQLHFRVQDKGIGIPAADLPRLFETFHRGANVGNIKGTGIGLHIVKQCVDLHQGTIEVESAPGAGTTFHVRLHAPVATA